MKAYFKIGDDLITVSISMFGKQKIYWNKQLASKMRSNETNVKHQFSSPDDSDQYTLTIQVDSNPISPNYGCTMSLYRNYDLLETKSFSANDMATGGEPNPRSIIPALIIGSLGCLATLGGAYLLASFLSDAMTVPDDKENLVYHIHQYGGIFAVEMIYLGVSLFLMGLGLFLLYEAYKNKP